MATTAAAAPWASQAPAALSPVDRVFEVLFGLIMALTFTGSLSVATADRNEVRSMLIGALGCNIAWGLVDAVMHLLARVTEHGRNVAVLREVQATTDPARARALIAEALPPVVASTMSAAELDGLRSRLVTLALPSSGLGLTLGDFRAAVAVFLMVFLATLPVALPFVFLHEAHRALRVSNGIALIMLFAGGFYLGRHGSRHPWLTGLGMLAIGVVLVWATIALGG